MREPRKLARFIERHYKDGPYQWTAADDDGQWVFQNQAGHLIGIIDRGTHYDLHDMANPNDRQGNPTAQIAKGKKLKVL